MVGVARSEFMTITTTVPFMTVPVGEGTPRGLPP